MKMVNCFLVCLVYIGKLVGYLGGLFFSRLLYSIWAKIYTGYRSVKFKSFGKSSLNPHLRELRGEKYISIGDGCSIGNGVTLTAIDRFHEQTFIPSIKIHDRVSIGNYSHITAIRSIIIEEGVLTGRYVTITDNAHGLSEMSDCKIHPADRILTSKGPVYICRNVWIGEKATILPGVTIGEGSVVAANAVVTQNIPPYSMVAGCPAKLIKTIKISS